MANPSQFLIDSNVLIQAKNAYYAFDICPGFWDALLIQFHAGCLCSIDSVKQEIVRGKDDLSDWVKAKVPQRFFKGSQQSQGVLKEYQQVMRWVNSTPQFKALAKADFASGADGWLVAYAKVHGYVVVTQEQLDTLSRGKVKIPNVCNQFSVSWMDTFQMLKALKVKLKS